jgi:hypothetical protein
MTMNFCEQKLDYMWSNFGIDHLVKIIFEKGAKIQANNPIRFWTATTSTHVKGYAKKQTN